MKNIPQFFLSVLLPVVVFGADSTPDEILIRPNPHVSEQALEVLLAVHGAKQTDSIPQLDVRVLRVPADKRDRVLEALQHNPNIEFAEPNGLASSGALPNDPYFVSGSEWFTSKVQAVQAWGVTSGGTNVTVAVVDSGVTAVPDLVDHLLPGYNFYSNNTDASDAYGHGTAVAGTLAGEGNNGIGVAGVAWSTSILPVRVADSTGWATYSNMAKGLTYAIDQGARIINISMYGSSSSSTLQSAVDYVWNHNGIVFACAGNAGTSALQYPAACRNVVAVSATDSSDLLASWSSYGSFVTVSAPGVGIVTTNKDGTYGGWSGTSFSSPITAAVGALLLTIDPMMTNSRVVDLIKQNSDDLGAAGWDQYYGAGRVNAYRTVLAAGGAPVDATAPVASVVSPASGSNVAGSVTVQAQATDNIGVTRLELYIDGVLAGTASSSPASFLWDTSATPDGAHVLRAVAYDAAGNSGASSDVSVTVQNTVVADTVAPVATITSPTSGTKVGKNLKVSVVGTDDVGVVRLELYADSRIVGSVTGSTATFSVNTTKWVAGQHQLQAIAYDSAGNAGASAVVGVVK